MLVRVKRDDGLVGARANVEQVPTLSLLVLIVEQGEVRHVADTRGIQALHREVVLPAVATQVLGAIGEVRQQDVDGLRGENFEGPHEVESEVDVVEVQWRVGGRTQADQVRPEAVGEEHGIDIGLDGPIVLAVDGLCLHLVPDVQEDVGVDHRRPVALRDPHTLEDVRAVALVDAQLLLLQHIHDRLLVPLLNARSRDTVGCDNREAIQGGPRRVVEILLDDACAKVTPKDFASPWLGVCP
mmetsp:Transcript_39789/g.112758  ORF Transcript_39789/g.112758 Transcript_39789/m.112758 type:complete len:241 (-) Transcript_39789:235-957(-)